MANKRIKDLSTTASVLAADDYVAIDGNANGTRKIVKGDLVNDISTQVAGTYLDEANNLSDVASKDTSKLNLEVPDVGTAPNEVPLNGQLGTMAYQSADSVAMGTAEVETLEVTGQVSGNLTVSGDVATSTRVAADTINGYTGASVPLTVQTGGSQDLILGTNATERVRIDSSGNVTVASGDVTATTGQFNSGASNASGPAFAVSTGNGIYNSGANQIGFSTNSTKRMTIDSLGALDVKSVGGASAAQFPSAASVNGITALPSATGTPFIVGRDTGSLRSAHFAGHLKFDSGYGIDFGSGASTTIDSYEEGTWTPVFAPNGGSFTTATTFVYIAKYTKVGNLVTANCYIRTDGTLDITGGSSAVRIQGLPFSTTSSNDYVSVNVGYALNWSAVPAGGYVAANNSYILLSKRETSITGNLNASSVSDLDTSGGAKNEIMISVTYQTT